MRLIYISQGNIPSKWAHTFQAMKMAEAFSEIVADFQLTTQMHWSFLLRPRFDFESWYGINHPFRIVRLPSCRAPRQDIFEGVWYPHFDRIAGWYAFWKRADLVFTRSPLAGRLCVRLGLRTIVESHMRIEDRQFRHIQAVAETTRLLGIVTVTDELKDSYRRAGIPKDKIYVWPDAVDLVRFSSLPPKEALRDELGIPVDRKVAMYCGHLYEHKGVSHAIAAARITPRVLFYLVGGWAQDIERCRRQAEGLKNVRLVGFVQNRDVPKYLRASDFLLSPNSLCHHSAHTTSPLKLFEYMAARRPIIGSDIPAFSGLLRHKDNAYLVEPDSAEAISAAIRRLENTPDLAAEMVDSAWQDVQRLTWRNRARAILKAFKIVDRR